MFINLKTLKDNPGQEITLTLNSGGVFEKKEYNGKSWNNYKYEVIQDGQVYSLDATDALHRKLSTLDQNTTFNLSYEEFTSNEGQLRHYWNVELFEQPKYENVKSNEFKDHLNRVKQASSNVKNLSDKIKEENTTYTNGARFGMIFNNVVKIFIANKMNMSTEEIVNTFKRVEGWVEACENPAKLPLATKDNEPVSREMLDTIVYDADDLPF